MMPNHIHIIWKVNENYKLENVQRDFLKFTGQQIKFDLKSNHPDVLEKFRVNLKDREYQFWQRKPLSVDLYSCKTIEQKLDYIHLNPLQERWNLATYSGEYYYSSASFYEKDSLEFEFVSHYKEDFPPLLVLSPTKTPHVFKTTIPKEFKFYSQVCK